VNGSRAIVLLTVLLSIVAAPVFADEAPRYNFASAQGGTSIGVVPGGEGRGTLYFYNIDGNRITHVVLTARGAPAGWEVRLEPPLREVEYSVNGEIAKVSENLPVEPSQLLSRETRDLPAGTVCIPVPGRGYAVAKFAQVVVRAPETAKVGDKVDVKVAAEAFWLGQSGTATIKQARDFDFTVEVVRPSVGHSETLLPPGVSKPSETDRGIGSLFADASWLPAMGAGAVLALGAVTVAGAVGRRRRRR